MISKEEFERYRHMTPGERLAETFRLTNEEMRRVLQGTTEEIDAFFERVNREHEESTRALCEGLARAKRLEELRAQSGDDAPGTPDGR